MVKIICLCGAKKISKKGIGSIYIPLMRDKKFPVVKVSSDTIVRKSLLKKEIYEQLFKRGFFKSTVKSSQEIVLTRVFNQDLYYCFLRTRVADLREENVIFSSREDLFSKFNKTKKVLKKLSLKQKDLLL